jgi:hypothetical protein
MWSISLINCSIMLWLLQNPEWLALSNYFKWCCPSWTVDWVNIEFGGVYGLYLILARPSLLVTSKAWGNVKAECKCLMKFVRCTRDLLKRCLRHFIWNGVSFPAWRSLQISVSHIVLLFFWGELSTACNWTRK